MDIQFWIKFANRSFVKSFHCLLYVFSVSRNLGRWTRSKNGCVSVLFVKNVQTSLLSKVVLNVQGLTFILLFSKQKLESLNGFYFCFYSIPFLDFNFVCIKKFTIWICDTPFWKVFLQELCSCFTCKQKCALRYMIFL